MADVRRVERHWNDTLFPSLYWVVHKVHTVCGFVRFFLSRKSTQLSNVFPSSIIIDRMETSSGEFHFPSVSATFKCRDERCNVALSWGIWPHTSSSHRIYEFSGFILLWQTKINPLLHELFRHFSRNQSNHMLPFGRSMHLKVECTNTIKKPLSFSKQNHSVIDIATGAFLNCQKHGRNGAYGRMLFMWGGLADWHIQISRSMVPGACS